MLLTAFRFSQWFAQACPPNSESKTCLPTVSASPDVVKTTLQFVFGIIGAVALIYIILAAFQFVIAQGNPDGIAKARQSIIYAVIGLAIAVSAEIIVTFVLGQF